MSEVTAALPTGARDVLPVEAAELDEIESALCDAFASFGYRRVATPTLELAEVLDRAQEGGLGAAYRLFDEHGRVLALRPDLTIPAARLIATRMSDHPGPVRVSYVASAFRPPTPGRADAAEQRQAGLELVGPGGPEADAEAIAVLAEGLRAAGLAGVRVGLGSVELTGAVISAMSLAPDAEAELRTALRARDHVAWRVAAEAAGARDGAAEVLATLPGMHGDVEVLDRLEEAVPGAAPAADRLRRTLGLLERHGGREAVVVDLGVMRDWPYYSGVVIEAYAPGVGTPVAMGGRYDGLVALVGGPRVPASGFALDAGRLADLLPAPKDGVASEVAVAVRPASQEAEVLAAAFQAAERVRRTGLWAQVTLVDAQPPAFRWELTVDSSPEGIAYSLHDRANDTRQAYRSLDDLLAALEAMTGAS